jgi:hypothetical protein
MARAVLCTDRDRPDRRLQRLVRRSFARRVFRKLSATARSLALRPGTRNSGLVQIETISGNGQLRGMAAPCEKRERSMLHVVSSSHIAGESMGS